MRRNFLILCLAVFSLTSAPITAHGFTVEAPLEDAREEARARALFNQFRCVVCQSESVADSPSEVAGDVRRAIRDMVHAGKSDEQIRRALVAGYGEFILMQPEFSPTNFALWLAPLLILLLGSGVAWYHFRRKPNQNSAH